VAEHEVDGNSDGGDDEGKYPTKQENGKQQGEQIGKAGEQRVAIAGLEERGVRSLIYRG